MFNHHINEGNLCSFSHFSIHYSFNIIVRLALEPTFRHYKKNSIVNSVNSLNSIICAYHAPP